MSQQQLAILALIGTCACMILAPLAISWFKDLLAGWSDESASKNHLGNRSYWEKHRAKGK